MIDLSRNVFANRLSGKGLMGCLVPVVTKTLKRMDQLIISNNELVLLEHFLSASSSMPTPPGFKKEGTSTPPKIKKELSPIPSFSEVNKINCDSFSYSLKQFFYLFAYSVINWRATVMNSKMKVSA